MFMYSAASAPRLEKISEARSSMSRLWEGLVRDHDGNAFSAAETAARASEVDAEEADQIGLLVTGLVTGNVVLVVISLPLMRRGTT